MKFLRSQNGVLKAQPETAPSNYISNPSPIKDTTGWATYADAAGTSPVDGTGGSPTVTWTRTTSSPLSETASFLFTKDAANRQGQGVSYDFSINREDLARPLAINFSYEVASGTYADGDLTAWLYDITNGGAPIQPSASSILNAIGPQKKQPLSFQTNSNSTSYRLIIHVASTSASAYTVKFDNVSVTRESISQGTVVTDWVSYTPTLTNGTNVSVTKVSWRRVGDSVEILGYLSVTGAGSGADLAVSMPSGIVMDTGKINGSANNHVLGSGEWLDNGTGRFVLMPVYASTTVFSFQKQQIGGLQGSDLASGDAISFTIRVPIVGWSSSQQLSSDADTRVVAAKYSLTSDETTAANADHIMTNFTTKVIDTHGAMSSSRFTAPVPGIYKVRCKALTTSVSWTTSDLPSMYLAKNGSTQVEFLWRFKVEAAFTERFFMSGETIVQLNAGEYVEINIRNGVAGTVPVIASGLSFFEVERISGPAQIAANEIVTGHYGGGTASVGNGATSTLVMTTKVFDSHGSTYNTSTGVWTCPAPGKYQFIYQASGGSDISATAVANNIQFGLTVDGAGEYGVTTDIACITSARRFNGRNTFILNLQAGQQVRFYASNGLGSGVTWTMLNNTNYSYFQWHRIGGIG